MSTIMDEQVRAAVEAQSKFRMRWDNFGKAMIVYDERGEEPIEIGRYESREEAGDAVLWHGQRAALEAAEAAAPTCHVVDGFGINALFARVAPTTNFGQIKDPETGKWHPAKFMPTMTGVEYLRAALEYAATGYQYGEMHAACMTLLKITSGKGKP